jgi:tetratricopeptide (TPR) repeat protein
MTTNFKTGLAGALGAAAFAVILAAAPSALAAGGGGGGSTPTCKQGQVWDTGKKMCVQSSSLDDKDLIGQGRALALAGHYEKALDVLSSVRNQKDDVALTYIGYSKRKLGQVDEGIAYYHQALAINPDNLNTREYLGEGYVSAGRMDLAVAELGKLEALCGTDCDQYEQLELAIAGTPDHWQ